MANKISTTDFLGMAYNEKIRIMMEDPANLDLPEEACYVAQLLAEYRPIVPPQPHLDNMSSIDIQETMQSICPIETKVISRIMKMLGYKLYFQGVSLPLWSMAHVDDLAVSTDYFDYGHGDNGPGKRID